MCLVAVAAHVLPDCNGGFGPCPDLLTDEEAVRYLRLTARLKGRKIGVSHFPRQTKAYRWYRFAAFSCFNPNSTRVANPARPPGFALGQLEFFGTPARKP